MSRESADGQLTHDRSFTVRRRINRARSNVWEGQQPAAVTPTASPSLQHRANCAVDFAYHRKHNYVHIGTYILRTAWVRFTFGYYEPRRRRKNTNDADIMDAGISAAVYCATASAGQLRLYSSLRPM